MPRPPAPPALVRSVAQVIDNQHGWRLPPISASSASTSARHGMVSSARMSTPASASSSILGRCPGSQLLDGEVIVAAILRTVGQRRAVRSDRAGDPALVAIVGSVPGLLGKPYAAADQLLRLRLG